MGHFCNPADSVLDDIINDPPILKSDALFPDLILQAI